jgi:hypothetical protein
MGLKGNVLTDGHAPDRRLRDAIGRIKTAFEKALADTSRSRAIVMTSRLTRTRITSAAWCCVY